MAHVCWKPRARLFAGFRCGDSSNDRYDRTYTSILEGEKVFPLFAFFCRVLRVREFNMDGVSGTGFEGSVDLQPRFQ